MSSRYITSRTIFSLDQIGPVIDGLNRQGLRSVTAEVVNGLDEHDGVRLTAHEFEYDRAYRACTEASR